MATRNLYYKNKTGILPWLGLAILIVVLDQLSKVWISCTLNYGQTIKLTPFFNLMLVYNKGAAFSFLASQAGCNDIFSR